MATLTDTQRVAAAKALAHVHVALRRAERTLARPSTSAQDVLQRLHGVSHWVGITRAILRED